MFNFRKITSVLTSAIMVSSTVALAAAANYPAPFVQNGKADVAIVYGGSDAQASDLAAASDIGASLSQALASQSIGGTETTVEGGDFVQIEKTTDRFNLGNNINSFYTTLDDGELSNILATGVYKNDANDEFDFEQEISFGSFTLGFQQDNEFMDETPYIGFDLADGQHVFNYTLDFSPDAAEGGDAGWSEIDTTDLTMLGRTYYVLSSSNTSGGTMQLLDSGAEEVVSEGETVTINTGDKSYEVKIDFITTNEVRLVVNGERTDSLAEGDTHKLSTGDYVGIKDISVQDYAGGLKQTEFSIGSGKITLVHGEEVEFNGEDISDLSDSIIKSYFTLSNSGKDIDKIVLEWTLDDDHWLAVDDDSEIVFPGFNNVKMYLGTFVTDATEMTTIKNNGDERMRLETELTDGKVSFDFLYYNATDIIGIGKDSDELLVTNATVNSGLLLNNSGGKDYFVATWISGDDSESYLLEVSDIDDSTPAKNTTQIKTLASGSNKAINLDLTDTTDDLGEIRITLVSAREDTNTAYITLAAASGSGSVYTDRVVTKEGLKVQLPFNSATSTAAGVLNLTAGDVNSWTMNFTEETKDGDINSGSSFTATIGRNTDGDPTVSSVSVTDYETEDGSDNYVGYVSSDLATKTMFYTGGDQDYLEVTYHGSQAYAEVYLSETGATLSSGSGSVGMLPVMDSQVDSVAGKNLIVVGGSCINSVAASLLGSSSALCGDAFTQKTGIGENQYLIQTFSRDGGKVATLVAGFSSGDTTNAATALRTQTIDTTVGKKYKGTTATSVEPVVLA